MAGTAAILSVISVEQEGDTAKNDLLHRLILIDVIFFDRSKALPRTVS